MGLNIPVKLNSVDLDCIDASGVDYVKRPFYVMGVAVNHNINLAPIYYIGGSWPNYGRRVWFQPISGGGSITLNGFFYNLENYNETYDYLTNSSKINPLPTTPASEDLDLRINGKQYNKCFCSNHSLTSSLAGENNIIYGSMTYLFSTVEDYP